MKVLPFVVGLVLLVGVNGNPPIMSDFLLTPSRLAMIFSHAVVLEDHGAGSSDEDETPKPKRTGYRGRKRIRRSVKSIYRELGPEYFRRAYRMDFDSFLELHEKLRPVLLSKTKQGARNGVIHTTARLSCALRYFAGGSPYDIALVHGISHSEVFNSLWKVVDAVNDCEDLAFDFPTSHDDQRALSLGFQKISAAGFNNCVGAIDGMLLWLEKPSLRQCELAKCGQLKFFCGRKHKYGFNLQGVCDSNNKFLDVSIRHPAATSDYLAFTTSKLYHMLETKDDYLADGLSIYGDNAYVNCRYMTVPFKNVKQAGLHDDYNFYQSQVRIKIECTFGMLVCRWGILRRPLPSTMGLKKSTALTMALCRLHNFCIDRRLLAKAKREAASSKNKNSGTTRIRTELFPGDADEAERDIAPALETDNAEILANGGRVIDSRGNTAAAFLLGNTHCEASDTEKRRRHRELKSTASTPRDACVASVEFQGLSRPVPAQWVKQQY